MGTQDKEVLKSGAGTPETSNEAPLLLKRNDILGVPEAYKT